jgi:hypothetical protein
MSKYLIAMAALELGKSLVITDGAKVVEIQTALETAFRAGEKAVCVADIGWTAACNKCGEEALVQNAITWSCNGEYCHEGRYEGHNNAHDN